MCIFNTTLGVWEESQNILVKNLNAERIYNNTGWVIGPGREVADSNYCHNNKSL